MRTRERKFRRDGGLAAHVKRIEEASKRKRMAVKVGLPKGSGEYPDGTSVIDVAVIHEFGAPGANIPMRSFLRSAIAEGHEEIRQFLRAASQAALEGRASARVVLEKLGTRAASLVQSKIVEGPFEPNTPETIARKGSSSPLQDTGLLKQSVTHEVIE